MNGTNSYDDLVRKSKLFFRDNKGCKVQTTVNLIKNFSHKRETIQRFANQAYPLIHESLLGLIRDFLSFKLKHGSSIERDFYKEMTVTDFVDRLVSKRPLVFFMPVDSWIAKVVIRIIYHPTSTYDFHSQGRDLRHRRLGGHRD